MINHHDTFIRFEYLNLLINYRYRYQADYKKEPIVFLKFKCLSVEMCRIYPPYKKRTPSNIVFDLVVSRGLSSQYRT